MARGKGYILLYRSVQDNEIWTAEAFSKGQAWIDLLLSANHDDRSFISGNDVIAAETGSVVTSELKLAERWKWSRNKTRAFLSLLEKLDMIERRTDKNRGTTIIIKKYKHFQKKGTTEGTNESTTETIENKGRTGNQETTESTTEGTNEGTTEGTNEGTYTNNYKYTKKSLGNNYNIYGKYNNIRMTDGEFQELKAEYGDPVVMKAVEGLSEWASKKGSANYCYAAAVRNWIVRSGGNNGSAKPREEQGETFADIEKYLE